MERTAADAMERIQRAQLQVQPTQIEPPTPVPEPFPEPSPPPQPVPVPEPTPEPSEPPGPAHVPEPTPAPSPPPQAGSKRPSRAGTPAAPTKSRAMRFRRLLPLLVALAGRLGDARERRRRRAASRRSTRVSSGCRRRSPGRSSASGRSPARSPRSTARSARLASQVGVVSTRLAPLERDLAAAPGEARPADRALPRCRRAGSTSTAASTRRWSTGSATGSSTSTRTASRARSRCCSRPKSVTDLIDAAQVRRLARRAGQLDRRAGRDREGTGAPAARAHEALPRPRRRRGADDRRSHQPGARAARPAAGQREPAGGCARLQARERCATSRRAKAEFLHEVAGLQARERLARARRSARPSRRYSYSPGDTTPSAAGFIWPVNGPVTSPFGWRWGRMHEGIDIGVGYGTPIHAAASGRVIYAGWMDGLRQPGRDRPRPRDLDRLRPPVAASPSRVGQIVSQGQMIGYVGCTGHCFGPHLHFEVRINGSPVDPLGYL